MITCPSCGRASRDFDFCDHCNADLSGPARSLAPARCPFLAAGEELTPEQRAALGRPESNVVVRTGAEVLRLHWISEQDWPQWRPFVDERMSHEVRSLPPCRRMEELKGAWIAAHTTGQKASPWNGISHLSGPERVKRLLSWLPRLVDAVEELHHRNLIWLTFEPGEIEETASGLWLTNMDLSVYPAGSCPERLTTRPMFAAPEVWKFQASDIGPATDVFHLAAFSYYWLAGLLPEGFAGGQGLKAFDYNFPLLRLFVRDLPLGISAVISRGLSITPADRSARPADFLNALQDACEGGAARQSSPDSVRWEVGAHSRTGKAKQAIGMGNEDSFVVQSYQDPPRTLLSVADGVTTCDVGTGALASLLTSLVLETTFDASCNQDSFTSKIQDACFQSSQKLLSWANEKGYRDQLRAGKDLMGTTLTAAWLEGNRISIANLGDSRAYLVCGDSVEQLTIDGDLGSGLLAGGAAPDEVHAMGLIAKCLRDCIGGCVVNSEGDLEILEEFCRPDISTWHLVPGDFVVLCSDGLVEERAFLEPAALAQMIGENPDLSPKELATKLCDAAEAKQRLPSALEPEGFGDNITCIVVKIVKA